MTDDDLFEEEYDELGEDELGFSFGSPMPQLNPLGPEAAAATAKAAGIPLTNPTPTFSFLQTTPEQAQAQAQAQKSQDLKNWFQQPAWNGGPKRWEAGVFGGLAAAGFVAIVAGVVSMMRKK